MTVAIRVIPCLDVSHGRVVKGVNFVGLRDAGDPVELAKRYNMEGADELTLLDITATTENRPAAYDLISRTAAQLTIPLTVGGGARSVDDIAALLDAGADKVSIGSAAVTDPELLPRAAAQFGSQTIVAAIDVKRVQQSNCPSGYEVTTHGGQRGTGMDAVEWATAAATAGAGEILLTSMDTDGTTDGFDLTLLRLVRAAVTVPLVASGGAGTPADFVAGAQAGAQGVLAASVFHFGTVSIHEVKTALSAAGFPVRHVAKDDV